MAKNKGGFGSGIGGWIIIGVAVIVAVMWAAGGFK
jgi:hypothetical protein